jgi:hypothetical protein
MDFMAGLVFSGRRLGVSLCEPGANAFGAGLSPYQKYRVDKPGVVILVL